MESEIKTYSKEFAEGFRFNNRNGVIIVIVGLEN
jgi:hypothetical protein